MKLIVDDKKNYNEDIINLIKERLKKGKKQYGGAMDIHDGRNWNVEALEEILDCCVYVAARILQIHEYTKNKIKNSGDDIEYKY
tara:strand:+ start:2077 stop:2328 length:252 start_codon:yes stop_codon:yes gene_type:complete